MISSSPFSVFFGHFRSMDNQIWLQRRCSLHAHIVIAENKRTHFRCRIVSIKHVPATFKKELDIFNRLPLAPRQLKWIRTTTPTTTTTATFQRRRCSLPIKTHAARSENESRLLLLLLRIERNPCSQPFP